MTSTWFATVNKADAPTELLIFDEIGSWGVTAKDFANALKGIPRTQEIIVGINSPGGNVADGLAIHNLLAQRRDKVTCRVDGFAGSIASVIALAGAKTVAPSNTFLFIHNPASIMAGESDEMRKAADDLDKITAAIAGIYAAKTKKPLEEIRRCMDDSTLFSADEAKEFGFVDEVTPNPVAWNSATLEQTVARLRTNTPAMPNKHKANMPNPAPNPPAADDAAQQLAAAKAEIEQLLNQKALLVDTIHTMQRAEGNRLIQAAIDHGAIRAEAKDAWLKTYLDQPEQTTVLLEGLQAPKPAPPNNRAGAAPVPTGATPDHPTPDDIRAKFAAMPAGPERTLFFRQHRALLI